MLFSPLRAARSVTYIPHQQLPGPERPADAPAWLAQMKAWRAARRQQHHYPPPATVYDDPRLSWTQHNYVQALVMVHDRLLYDPDRRTYTVDRLLDDLQKRYGGVDSVVLWGGYPNIGIDERNQHDLLRDLPGGLPALKDAVDLFHRRGVRVLLPALPWDSGTRREAAPLAEAIVQSALAIGADGIFGDTLAAMPGAFTEAIANAGAALALLPENGLHSGQIYPAAAAEAGVPENALATTPMSWGYWKTEHVPTVSAYKWLEPRHMVHLCQRWSHYKNEQIQDAFFNGIGIVAWENVWGIWNQITGRDAEAIRRVAHLQRAFGDMLCSADFEPHVPTRWPDVFASRFPQGEAALYCLINRADVDAAGEVLSVPHLDGMMYVDVWSGYELTPRVADGVAHLRLRILADGFCAVLVQPKKADDEHLRSFLNERLGLMTRSLLAYDPRWRPTTQEIVEIATTEPAAPPPAAPPAGMVYMPATRYRFRLTGIMIEGGNGAGVDVQYPWEKEPQRQHDHIAAIAAFYIDRDFVSNADFKAFLDATGYRPADDHNFLRHWGGSALPAELADEPVVWVSLDDARAYAAWAGKRLPHEWEWQYAAETAREMVTPRGKVWQWTDEYRDGHTRAAVLRGGSSFRPAGSHWYFPTTTGLDQHGKYLLMAPSLDRSSMIGFRCARDCTADAPTK